MPMHLTDDMQGDMQTHIPGISCPNMKVDKLICFYYFYQLKMTTMLSHKDRALVKLKATGLTRQCNAYM